jgi:hypothetical protein
MRLKAIALGEQIVAREALLDELFASGAASPANLREATEALGLLNGRLRGHHLAYHLAIASCWNRARSRAISGSGAMRRRRGRARMATATMVMAPGERRAAACALGSS